MAKSRSSAASKPVVAASPRLDAWQIIIYYRVLSRDLSERTDTHIMYAASQMDAANAADRAATHGIVVVIPEGKMAHRIPAHRILQVTFLENEKVA